ncbi:serine/threonine-protein kinase [Streptomyces sp900105245]|uniref:serine/threonine-protein kinase n=1 Tax=Streptomyces sp. 900105245 TaxID=3154379 RepID=UPI003319AD43
MTEDGEHPPDGRLIGGRYRLTGRLGSGPAGTVWHARDERDDVRVAVKEPLLPGDPAEDEESRRVAHRLYREARTATRVRHPSAVTVHDVVTEDEVPWIVMELVEGESLRTALRRGPLPPAEAARVGLAVLGALRAAHAVGIVHRDVKPANVLLEDGTGRVVLTDFGIGDGHPDDAPAGFVAPERAAGPGAGPASDLWSLGALLRAALGDADPGPLGPLADRLQADEPGARPGAEEAEAALRAYLGLTPVPEQAGRPAGSGRSERSERSEQPDQLGKSGRPEKSERPGESGRSEKPEQPGKSERSAESGRSEPSAGGGPDSPTGSRATAPAPPADPRRRTPFAALGLLLAKKPGAE